MISGAVRALLLLSAFSLGALPPIPRGIGMGESSTEGGCCAAQADSEPDFQAGCPLSETCSPCCLNEPSQETSNAAPVDCQRCVCCLCGIGLPAFAPEIPHVEIVTLIGPEIEDEWVSISSPPAPPPPEVRPFLSFIQVV